ncbi:hypothetical protein BACOVA_00293 [Bacteroides ovatus ATCC 8483]|uniref:Uncharacterized protein n=1 Tax=Bacteroides ovatus (strain ATCC 8483 / DSM 1896 / JCM 5824 / BCRC 10623 / CCUG 4943 / NCTC 11153) TaxID=411476 RepID=A0AAN3ACH3_BACO1|nr:hypothetical protein BACOVA_00293 [Bacteroides ovatus ATCC 8483]
MFLGSGTGIQSVTLFAGLFYAPLSLCLSLFSRYWVDYLL